MAAPLSTPMSHALVALTIELDNLFELRLAESGRRARVTSWVMWANTLRFVGEGIAVGELPATCGLQKPRVHSTLGGLERWGYVAIGPESKTRRDGYGSARGLRAEWSVRLTPAGRAAAAIWSSLPEEMDARWRNRFGAETIEELRDALTSVAERLELELPEYLPIVGSANGMLADLPSRPRLSPPPRYLLALLAQVLLAYALDIERESELSLPLSANVVRVLDANGVGTAELPARGGVSKEAVAMALTFLTKTGHVVVENKSARLTARGREAQSRQPDVRAAVEAAWRERFGAETLARLRSALSAVLDRREALSQGLEPPETGWRATGPYVDRTRALLEDSTGALPHYPMVLHRGGWPDGS